MNGMLRSRNLLALLLLLSLTFVLVGTSGDKWLSRTSLIDRLASYEVMKLSSGIGPADGGAPTIYYFESLGEIVANEEGDYVYVRPTWISLDAVAEDVRSVRRRIISHLNTSEENARQLVFHDRLVVSLATLETIARAFSENNPDTLAPHVYDVMAEMAEDSDPFRAAFPLECFTRASYWSSDLFESALQHEIAQVRAAAIDYFERIGDALTNRDRLYAMRVMAPLLEDPHLGIRYLCKYNLRKGIRTTSRSFSKDSQAQLTARAIEEEVVESLGPARQQKAKALNDHAAADVERWKAHIGNLLQEIESETR